MATAQNPIDTTIASPGQDSLADASNMQQNVTSNLNNMPNVQVAQDQVIPAAQQKIASTDLEDLMSKPEVEMDLEDMWDGQKGKPRSEPSKNFLKVLLGRLKKQHPDGEIIKEGGK